MNFSGLQRHTVVITGVTRGLGRAMTDELIRVGHRVLGCARTRSDIEELTRMYPGQNFQTVDVASDIEVNGWANRLLQRHGPPDYVINNAAVINVKCPLWKVGAQEFSEEIDTNIKGVVNTIRHFTPPMIDRGSGVFVNVNSRWGKRFEMQMAPYCATKWALVVLTRVLAEELKPHGIAAVGLNPGVVKTGMLRRYLGTDEIPNESEYLDPQEWATHAVPFILQLGMKDSGKMRNVIRRLTSEVRRV